MFEGINFRVDPGERVNRGAISRQRIANFVSPRVKEAGNLLLTTSDPSLRICIYIDALVHKHNNAWGRGWTVRGWFLRAKNIRS